MTAPVIKRNFWNLAASEKPAAFDVANRALELQYAAEQSQEQYITADEARKLGAGNVEYWWSPIGAFIPCQGSDFVESFNDGEVIKYRAIKQPEPVEPTCQVRNIDTGVTETMTRGAAKKLQAELGDTVEWFFPNGLDFGNHFVAEFKREGIYTYKLKANLVKIDGKLMTREAAIALWESKKDTCDVWFKSNKGDWIPSAQTQFSESYLLAEYQLRERPLKQIEWKDVPQFVRIRCVKTNRICTLLNVDDDNDAYCFDYRNQPNYINLSDLELAPADQQDWIATQKTFEKVEGLIYETKADAGCGTSPRDIAAFKVVGIAKGWKL